MATRPNITTSFGTATSGVVKPGGGSLLGFTANNINAAVRFLQFFNSPTAPAVAAVPLLSFPIAAGTATAPGNRDLGTNFFTNEGATFDTGISWGISSTQATFTAATAADHTINIFSY